MFFQYRTQLFLVTPIADDSVVPVFGKIWFGHPHKV